MNFTYICYKINKLIFELKYISLLAKNNLIEKLQTLFSVTKTELNFVIIIIIGLLIGLIGKYTYYSNYSQDKINILKIQKMLDSIALAEKSTYTGTDTKGNIDSVLAKGDTIIKNDNGSYKRKELPTSKININNASKDELTKLPGIGDKMADVILDYKKKHSFKKIEDFMKIKGIGKKKFAKIEPFIKVE